MAQLESVHTLWTVADVADYLRVSVSWVYKKAADGTLPTVRVGTMLRFDPDAVRTFARGVGVQPNTTSTTWRS